MTLSFCTLVQVCEILLFVLNVTFLNFFIVVFHIVLDTDEGEELNGNSSTGSEIESDHDEAFSPLMEHFEELATPSKELSQRDLEELRTVHQQQQLQQMQEIPLKQHQPDNSKFISGHRASISAKFLSRSQKSSSTSRYFYLELIYYWN